LSGKGRRESEDGSHGFWLYSDPEKLPLRSCKITKQKKEEELQQMST
jgi:hypothetical protein